MKDDDVRLTLRVPRDRAEAVREIIMAWGILDPGRSIGRDDEEVHLPVILRQGKGPSTVEEIREGIGEDVVVEAGPGMTRDRRPKLGPVDQVRVALAEVLRGDLVDGLPRGWDMVGDAMVLKLPAIMDPYRKEVCEAYARAVGARYVLIDLAGTDGELREPGSAMGMAPPDGRTEVVHVENGIRYELDPTRVMFSSGNVGVRTAALSLSRDVPLGRTPSSGPGREIVYDMFAGIGYFSLPIALGDPGAIVLACEKNPASYRFLARNVHGNGLAGRVVPVLGDCREAMPSGRADRIVMGYLGGTVGFLPYAMECLSRSGGIVHLHDTVKVDEGIPGLFRKASDIVRENGGDVRSLGGRRIKSYAPMTDHVLIDLAIWPSV